MALRINQNIPSINVQRLGKINNRELKMHIERLSSGLRVNRAADDASGLSVSEGMRAEISGLRQGAMNTQNAIDLIQTAEGALNEVSAMLIRMRQLAVQSASSTVNDGNRESINAEFAQLITEIDRIAGVTSYNNASILSGFGNTLDEAASTAAASQTTGLINVQLTGAASGTYQFLDPSNNDREITLGNGVVSQTIDIGTALDVDGAIGGVVASGSAIIANFDRLGIQLVLSGQKAAEGINPATDGYRDGELDGRTLVINQGVGGTFQIGPDDGAVHRLEANLEDMRATANVINLGGVSLSTQSAAQGAISSIELAIVNVSQVRGDLGALQNRLSHSLRNTENSVENVQSSESSIRDADIGLEVSEFTSSQILVQSTTAMLTQANVLPQNALTLLQ